MMHVVPGLAVMGVGLISLQRALGLVRRDALLRRQGVRRPGVVVRHDANGDGNAWAPVVSFVDESGVPHEFVAGMHKSLRLMAVGTRTTVVHLADRPKVAALVPRGPIRSEIVFWFVLTLLAFAGGVMVLRAG